MALKQSTKKSIDLVAANLLPFSMRLKCKRCKKRTLPLCVQRQRMGVEGLCKSVFDKKICIFCLLKTEIRTREMCFFGKAAFFLKH